MYLQSQAISMICLPYKFSSKRDQGGNSCGFHPLSFSLRSQDKLKKAGDKVDNDEKELSAAEKEAERLAKEKKKNNEAIGKTKSDIKKAMEDVDGILKALRKRCSLTFDMSCTISCTIASLESPKFE